MNEIIKSNKRYLANHVWLKSYHLFSFAEYYDTGNQNFWNLRVFNDDYIKARNGFWLHPHSNMEILTIVLEWEITHWDSMWNNEVIKAWEIQTMTAWEWIFHSENNFSNEDMHLYQIWFLTNQIWLKPDYKNHKIFLEKNKLNLLASWDKDDNVWFLNSDVKVYRWIYEKWQNFNYEINENRWLFIYIKRWKIKIWDDILEKEDQTRFSFIWKYDFEILDKNTEFLLINVSL